MKTVDGVQNRHIKMTASALGVLLALSGIINHGIFEILHGNVATSGIFIEAIGEEHRFWIHGTEGAITLIPNYLYTGFATVVVSLLAIIWSIKHLDTKNGIRVFTILFLLMLLTGGGIGFLFVFLPTLAYATRIHSDLGWWNRVLNPKIQVALSKVWLPLIIISLTLWATVMELGIFGYFPGQTNPDAVLSIVMIFLLGTVLCINVTFISAIAADLQSK